MIVVLNLLNILFTDRGDNTQGKLDLPVVYSLHEELKKILRAYKNKKEKIPACSNCPEFHFAISCFRNYEVSYSYCHTHALLLFVCMFVCVSLCICIC